MMPETEKDHAQFINMIVSACRRPTKIVNSEGKEVTEIILDAKKLDYKTQLVSSTNFSRFVLELEEFANIALDVFNFMSWPRASVISEQILRHVRSYGYSIDAKSSETMRDPHNSQSSLVHIMTSNKSERKITLKENAKESLWSSIGGNEKRRAASED